MPAASHEDHSIPWLAFDFMAYKKTGSSKTNINFDTMFEDWWVHAPPYELPDPELDREAYEHIKGIARGAMMTALEWASHQSAHTVVETCLKFNQLLDKPDYDDGSTSLNE